MHLLPETPVVVISSVPGGSKVPMDAARPSRYQHIRYVNPSGEVVLSSR